MHRFQWLEDKGLAVAAISEREDGDCGFKADYAGLARKQLCESLNLDSNKLVCLRQVHGNTVVQVHAEDAGKGAQNRESALADADGLITNQPGIPLGISVADCVPLWLYDPVTQSGGVVHAGRQSTYHNIAKATVGALKIHFSVDPLNLYVCIGPSAGPERYEVSQEIAQDFQDSGYPVHGRTLDLWATNQQQLCEAGLVADNIEVMGYCTLSGDRFFSYRSGDDTARNLALFSL